MDHFNRVLVVDDSASIRNLISIQAQTLGSLEIIFASNYSDAEQRLQHDSSYLCAVLDLNLPDAPNGEVIDLVQKAEIPVIILAGSINSAIKKTMKSDLVIDYIVKRKPSDIEYLASMINNIYNNQFVKVLVVDDSIIFRDYLASLLSNLRYFTRLAANGIEALNVIKEHPDISLVITDYYMPKMNGLRLIEEIRKDYRREEMAILGLSVQDDNELIVKLLKIGANDYMTKPLIVNEFYCRVHQSTNMIGYIRAVNESATIDYLTKTKNRRSLFQMGELIYENAVRKSISIAVAMIDADYFKKVNDEYGHDIGDQVLLHIAQILKAQLRVADIISRFGGEEFVCVVMIKEREDVYNLFERIRLAIKEIEIEVEGAKLDISVSIGVTKNLCSSFKDMISLADRAMFQAKEAGRNRVIEI